MLLISGIVGVDTAHFCHNSPAVSIIWTHTISFSPGLLHNTILRGVADVISSGLDDCWPLWSSNWSWRWCWVVLGISNAMLCRGVFEIVVVGSTGSAFVEARILMNFTWIILKVWWIVVYIMKRTMVRMAIQTVGYALSLTLTLLIDSHGGKQKGDCSFALFLSLVFARAKTRIGSKNNKQGIFTRGRANFHW